jgi:hypothetical protein
MSIDPEDSLLEEALRNDLPSPGTEARLRRRMLAAGLAVGNGVAATTAAAGGTAGGVASAGAVAKVLGLSWGVKLGLAAAVAIPTVGVLLEAGTPEPSPRAAVVAPARPSDPIEPSPSKPVPQLAAMPEAKPLVRSEIQQPRSPSMVRAEKPPETVVVPAPTAAHPSRSDFAVVEPEVAQRAPEVASTLAEETRLLDGALSELAAGNRARAAALIQEHEARYPQGLLQKERERAKTRLSELSRGE